MNTVGIFDSGETRLLETQPAHATAGILVDAYAGQTHNELISPHNLHRIREITARLITIRDGYLCILPRLDGVVLTSDGRLVMETTLFTDRLAELADFDRIKRTAVTLAHPIFSAADTNWYNFYHWTALTLAKFGVVDRHLPPDLPFVAPRYGAHDPAVVPRSFSADTHAASLRELRFGRPVLHLKPGVYRCPELHLLWINSANPADLTLLRSLFPPFGAVGRRFDTGGARKLYIERRDNPRMLPDEAIDARRMALARGFDVVQLETSTFAQQVEMFANAEQIVATHGAGLANLLYARPGTRVLELNTDLDGRGGLRPWFYYLAQGARLRYSYLNGSMNDFAAFRLEEAFDRLAAA